jgi:uncharacterized protein
MRWQAGRRSENIEDQRGAGPAAGIGVRGAGISGVGLLAIVLIGWFLGIDPTQLLQGTTGDGSAYVPAGPSGAEEEQLKDFVSAVLAETEDTWGEQFRRTGRTYEQPKLVLYSGAVESACGFAQSAMGPFYCPGDHKVYLDLSFFQELSDRFGAPGDFAEAYVIAHEVGHHVQTLLGIMDKVNAGESGTDETERNAMSVRLELQADCLAGVWARNTDRERHILESGDIDEALQAAAAVGDDRLQRESQGYVVPDSFTHGSSEQRVRWFKRGMTQGEISACDTLGAAAI